MEFGQGLEHVGLALERHSPIDQKEITVEVQPSRGSDCGVEHSHRARRSAARVCKTLSALLLLLAVERFEGLAVHDDLAARFKVGWQGELLELRAVDAQRRGAKRLDGGRGGLPRGGG